MKTFLHAAFILTASAFPVSAFAEPLLRTDVAVEHAIVTVGDLFADAGINAERAMFRAPAPGTTGAVSVDAIRLAARRVGITEFGMPPVDRIRVERTGVPVSLEMIEDLIRADLARRGLVTEGVITRIALNETFPTVHAATTGEPAKLKAMNYTPGAGIFGARFAIAGYDEPLELHGRIDFLIEAPHLTESLASGTILSPDHIEMRPVQLKFAENGGLATTEHLVGKELKRPAREGMMIRLSDVIEPQVIKRSDTVTLYYAQGPLRLTVKGQALNAAAEGEAVSVLNLVSKKVVHGIATERGAVELVLPHTNHGLES